MTDVQIINDFFARLFGVVSGFFLYIFENVEIYGLNMLEVLFLFIVIGLLIAFVKVVL